MSSDLRKGVVSSVLLVSESILKKMIGLVSTVVLARVLLPEDFGIIAIATLAIGLIEVLSTTGSKQYLLKVEELTIEQLNTSFTINLIIRLCLSVVLTVASVAIARYYGDERIAYAIVALTVIFVLQSFSNPGVAFFEREQEYGKLVKVSLTAKILAVIVGLVSALTLQNYWALVLGQLTNALCMLVGSYFVHPHRPKLSLSNAAEQWNFSGWMIPQAIFGYVRTQLDTFLVSSAFGQAQLGSYHTMKYIAYIPSAHIILPAVMPFLVELRKVKKSPELFAVRWNATLILTFLIAIPITLLLHLLHQPFVALLLGKQWVEYSPLMSYLALLIPSFVMLAQVKRILIIHGKTKVIFFFECIAFTFIYSFVYIKTFDDLFEFTYFRSLAENFICFLLLLYTAIKYTSFENAISMLISSLPLLVGTCVAGYLTMYFGPTEAPLVFQVFFSSMICLISFYLSVVMCYLLLLRNRQEWQYLHKLSMRIARVGIESVVGKLASR